MVSPLLLQALMLVAAATVAIVLIAMLRPVLRRYCGATAVLRLWWIIPVALLAVAVPKSAPPVWLESPALVQRAASPVVGPKPIATSGFTWQQWLIIAWLVGACGMASADSEG